MLYTYWGYTSGKSYNAKLGSTINRAKWNGVDSYQKGMKNISVFNGACTKIVQFSYPSLHVHFPYSLSFELSWNTNLSLTEREGRTGNIGPRYGDSALHSDPTKATEGQYSPVRLELARLVTSLLYGTRAMLVLNLSAFENKKIHSLWQFPCTETVRMATSRPRKNQSELLDIPQDYLVIW